MLKPLRAAAMAPLARQASLVATCCLTGWAAAPEPAVAAGRHTAACAMRDSEAVATSRFARVFEHYGEADGEPNITLYGCLYSRGKRVRLADERDDFYVEGKTRARLSGRFVLYRYDWDSGAAGGFQIGRADLRQGRYGPRFTYEDNWGASVVTDDVLQPNGAFAFIWRTEEGEREVRGVEADANPSSEGARLAVGSDIARRSLWRSRTRVFWTQAGRQQSAPLR